MSAAILAYDLDVDPIYLVDQPIKSREPGLRRVSSPFTVETHSPHRYLTIDEALGEQTRQRDQARDDVDARILQALEGQGITLGNGERARFEEIVAAEGHQVITHRARGAGAHRPDTCIALFGPDETVNRFAERRALTEAALYEDTENLLLIGFGFEVTHKTERQGRIVVHRVQAHQDLRIGELAPDSKADTLVLVAEPDVELQEVENSKWTVEVKGFDSYNPATGQVTPHEGVKEIECLMIDTDYDGAAFFARAIHFPSQSEDRRLKRLKDRLGAQLDPDHWERASARRAVRSPRPRAEKSRCGSLPEPERNSRPCGTFRHPDSRNGMNARKSRVSWVGPTILSVMLAMTATSAANAETGGDPHKRSSTNVLRDIAVRAAVEAATKWLDQLMQERIEPDRHAAARYFEIADDEYERWPEGRRRVVRAIYATKESFHKRTVALVKTLETEDWELMERTASYILVPSGLLSRRPFGESLGFDELGVDDEVELEAMGIIGSAWCLARSIYVASDKIHGAAGPRRRHDFLEGLLTSIARDLPANTRAKRRRACANRRDRPGFTV